MARIGMNPGRGQKSDYVPDRVTACMLTYVPNQVGYFEKRFDVMKLSLESLIRHTSNCDIMVFDNGSSPEVVEYLKTLRDTKRIHFLILSSVNIGKISALQIMFRAAPGKVIAYNDDDVFFMPGWLERQLEVLDTYPNVGLVSGFYIKPHMKEGIQSVEKFSRRAGVKVERGNLIERSEEDHYIKNMGRTWERYQSEIEGLHDLRLTYKGVTTFASAGHYQFVAPKDVIIRALPSTWNTDLMGRMRDLDVRIDQLGYLRLCTHPSTLRLLGNQINEDAAREYKAMGFSVEGNREVISKTTLLTRVYRSAPVQKIAYFFYNRLFKIINA